MDSISPQTELDFQSARFRAFMREVATLAARRPNELVSFDTVQRTLSAYGSSYRGVQTVPLDQIVGSATNRYLDFDRAFLPAQGRTKSRWKNIDAALIRGEELPPVQLYELGGVYFVRDGHHRISVARQQGRQYIEAEVIQVRTRVPVSAVGGELDADDLEIIGEYSVFLEKTGLDRLRPGAEIRFSQAGGYPRLLEHIVVHRYYMGLDQRRDVTWEEAVGDWYDAVYCPIIDIIREREILKEFPNRTEADLYLWIMDHHHYLQERGEPGLDRAAEDYAENYSPRLNRRFTRILRGLVAQWRADHPGLPARGEAEAHGS